MADQRLQAFLAYLLAASDRQSIAATQRLSRVLRLKPDDEGALEWLHGLGGKGFRELFYSKKPGAYRRLNVAMRYAGAMDLENCSLHDVLSIPGIGQKTARMFWVYGRREDGAAILDMAILRWMRARGVEVHASSPYASTEAMAMAMLAAEYQGMDMADADLIASSGHNNRIERER